MARNCSQVSVAAGHWGEFQSRTPFSFDSHVFHLDQEAAELEDYVEEIAVVRTLPDDCEYRDFFWNHAEDIATKHGIPLHDIVLCTYHRTSPSR